MNDQYGIISGMILGLGVIARFIWRWEKTFGDAAIEELKFLRKEVKNLRAENLDLILKVRELEKE